MDGCKETEISSQIFYSFLGQERAVVFHMKAIWNPMVPTKARFFAWEVF